MWEVRIQHEGLRASRVLTGATEADAQWKATLQLCLWDERWSGWQRTQAVHGERLTRQKLALHGHRTAAQLTTEVAERSRALQGMLAASLERGVFLEWDLLKDKGVFVEPMVRPEPPRMPAPQLLKQYYEPELTALDNLLSSRRRKKQREAREHFTRDLAAWRTACFRINQRTAAEFCRRIDEREQQRQRHRAAQVAQHAKVDEVKAAFERHERSAVEYFFAEVLSRSSYPSGLPQEATVQYVRATRTLIVEYELPPFSAWPGQQDVSYNSAQNRLKYVAISDARRRSCYDDGLHQMALRVLAELFAHDYARSIDRVAFNGWVRSIDQGTGNSVHVCLLSVLVGHATFTAINLSQVDAKTCFRKLNGVASPQPVELLPVKPLLSLKVDNSFPTDLHMTADTADDALPVAAMRRSELEALIHEAFEREFRKNRSQVRLAQVTHDLAFELDRDALS
jgi:restriction system protein